MYIKQWNKRTILPLTLEFYRLIALKPRIHRDKRRLLPVRFVAVCGDTPVSRLIERVNLDCLTHVLVDGDPEQLMPEQDYVAFILDNGLNGTVGLVYSELRGHNGD
jgi:hypothetical protein